MFKDIQDDWIYKDLYRDDIKEIEVLCKWTRHAGTHLKHNTKTLIETLFTFKEVDFETNDQAEAELTEITLSNEYSIASIDHDLDKKDLEVDLNSLFFF